MKTDTMDKEEVAGDKLTGHFVETSLVEYPSEHFETDDGINDNDKHYKKSDV